MTAPGRGAVSSTLTEVGLSSGAIPERYGAHLLVPFLLGRLEGRAPPRA